MSISKATVLSTVPSCQGNLLSKRKSHQPNRRATPAIPRGYAKNNMTILCLKATAWLKTTYSG